MLTHLKSLCHKLAGFEDLHQQVTQPLVASKTLLSAYVEHLNMAEQVVSESYICTKGPCCLNQSGNCRVSETSIICN